MNNGEIEWANDNVEMMYKNDIIRVYSLRNSN